MKYTIKVRKSKEENWRIVVGGIECSVIEAGKLVKHFSRSYRYVKLTSFQPE
jgi:hypothetical protein